MQAAAVVRSDLLIPKDFLFLESPKLTCRNKKFSSFYNIQAAIKNSSPTIVENVNFFNGTQSNNNQKLLMVTQYKLFFLDYYFVIKRRGVHMVRLSKSFNIELSLLLLEILMIHYFSPEKNHFIISNLMYNTVLDNPYFKKIFNHYKINFLVPKDDDYNAVSNNQVMPHENPYVVLRKFTPLEPLISLYGLTYAYYAKKYWIPYELLLLPFSNRVALKGMRDHYIFKPQLCISNYLSRQKEDHYCIKLYEKYLNHFHIKFLDLFFEIHSQFGKNSSLRVVYIPSKLYQEVKTDIKFCNFLFSQNIIVPCFKS